MAGILDSKTRVLDSIITLEGRKQFSQGGINIHYVTFTDAATFYKGDVVSGSADATARIYLEQSHLPQDQVTLQADDDGLLMNDLGIFGGKVEQINPDAAVAYETVTPLTGTELVDYFEKTVLPNTIKNFQKQQAIATRDPVFEDDGFALGNSEIQFTIVENKPIPNRASFIGQFENLQDIFADLRMAHVDNFKFLPPINRVDDSTVDKSDRFQVSKFGIGHYRPWSPPTTVPQDQRFVELQHDYFTKNGYVRHINIDPTSRDNNLFIQAFEVTHGTMHKLHIIDFGSPPAPPPPPVKIGKKAGGANIVNIMKLQAATSSTFRTFFVGKLVTKPETGTHSFVHLFTLIFG